MNQLIESAIISEEREAKIKDENIGNNNQIVSGNNIDIDDNAIFNKIQNNEISNFDIADHDKLTKKRKSDISNKELASLNDNLTKSEKRMRKIKNDKSKADDEKPLKDFFDMEKDLKNESSINNKKENNKLPKRGMVLPLANIPFIEVNSKEIGNSKTGVKLITPIISLPEKNPDPFLSIIENYKNQIKQIKADIKALKPPQITANDYNDEKTAAILNDLDVYNKKLNNAMKLIESYQVIIASAQKLEI